MHFYFGREVSASRSIQDATYAAAKVVNGQNAVEGGVSAETSGARTRRIIECHDPKVGKFYTNAASCNGADLDNRISYAQTAPAPLARSQYKQRKTISKAPQRVRPEQKPNLRLTGKSPPPGLPPECRFPVGRALEIERILSAADDPRQSTWAKSYCRFRCEALRERCPVNDSDFHYSYYDICPGDAFSQC